MKNVTLLHNPGAGDEAHNKETLIRLIESEGYKCHYVPVKESGMDVISGETDFIVIAGGDGTVRKVAKQLLLSKESYNNQPLAILPMGTANNIAKTLGWTSQPEDIVKAWALSRTQAINIWEISNLPGARFFAEGLGYGVFPQLIREMKQHDEDLADEPEKRIDAALRKLLRIVETYPPVWCDIQADGRDYSGRFILVELMNISSIGPNLRLAENADPSDEMIEIVLIADEQRSGFAAYLEKKISGSDHPYQGKSIRAQDIRMKWYGDLVHVDDELIEMKEPKESEVSYQYRKLNFLAL